jgi:hypothetical protein
MITNNRAPSIHPILQGAPSYETYKARVIHKLVADLNVMTELLERVKTCTGIRPPDRYGEHYSENEHLRLAEEGRYREALSLIALKGRR